MPRGGCELEIEKVLARLRGVGGEGPDCEQTLAAGGRWLNAREQLGAARVLPGGALGRWAGCCRPALGWKEGGRRLGLASWEACPLFFF